MPFVLAPVAVAGDLRWEWVDPSGVVRDLTFGTSSQLFVSRGASGLGVPGVDLVTDKLPFAAGAIPRRINTRPLEIDLPIHVQAASFSGLLTSVETMRGWFNTGDETTRRPGYLRITRPQDDAVRQIACYYVGGLEGDLSRGVPTWAPLVVSLLAPDAYWTDITETSVAYAQADVGADLSVINVGHVDAYPIWTIHGPAHTMAITNTTAGKAFALQAGGAPGLTLSAFDTLTVDTRPSNQRSTIQVYAQDGTSHYHWLTSNSSLWWLAAGQNHLRIDALGTTGATSFGLRWLPRYRGVLR
jgi:hypothetical protein